MWVGRDVSEALRKAASDAGMAHLSSGVARRTDTSILIVKQGAEPRPFTAHFATWVVDPAVVRGPGPVRGPCMAEGSRAV